MFKNPIKLIVLLLLLIALYLVWHNRWWFFDEYRLYGYTPPASISQLATDDQLTNYAKTLFYVYHPSLENSTEFNNNCKVTTAAIVLGCTVIGKGIYLFDIQDSTLNGVEQVTAAYEMLHVGYSRLSGNELKTINQLVMSTYDKISPTDPLLQSEYNSYLKTEGSGALENEMHSTLGTEIANLPPALENYYKRYFSNRQVIVNYANQYESVFTNRQNQVNADDAQLASLKTQIDSLNSTLVSEYASLKSQQTSIENLKSTDSYTQYNSAVNSYNNLVNLYNSQIYSDQNLVSQYNELVAQRNAIALSENKLSNEINSLSTTVPAN